MSEGILTEFIDFTAGNATEQKRLDDLLDDPLGRRMANTMHTSAEEGASKEASRSKNKHTRIAFKADMENFFSVAARVHASDVPDEIIGREYEKKYMEEFWNRHVLGGVGASLCITGCPGSGKTALLSHFIRCKLSGDNNSSYPIRMLQLNSMSLPDPSRLLSVLLARLSRRKFSGKLLEEIALKSMLIPPCASVRRKLPMYIITLDEIDHMAHRNAKDIYRLFEWTAAPNSRLVFIGISNTLNFIDKHMPLLKSMDCAPNSLNFKPYSVPEIRDVVASRLAQKSPSSLNIHPSALELIARKASSTGDLRKALALCRSALRIAAQSDSPSTQLSLENALAASRVPSHQKKSALITSLTLQQKTVLTALAKEKRDTPLISLFITYRSLCTQLTSGISQVSRSEFSDIVAFLESLGIVNLYSKSRQLSSSSNLSTDWLSTLVAPCFSPNDLPIPL